MTEFWINTIVSFLGGGLVSQVFNWLASRKKDQTEIDVTISEAWEKYAAKMEMKYAEIEEKYCQLQMKYWELEKKYYQLERSIKHD